MSRGGDPPERWVKHFVEERCFFRRQEGDRETKNATIQLRAPLGSAVTVTKNEGVNADDRHWFEDIWGALVAPTAARITVLPALSIVVESGGGGDRARVTADVAFYAWRAANTLYTGGRLVDDNEAAGKQLFIYHALGVGDPAVNTVIAVADQNSKQWGAQMTRSPLAGVHDWLYNQDYAVEARPRYPPQPQWAAAPGPSDAASDVARAAGAAGAPAPTWGGGGGGGAAQGSMPRWSVPQCLQWLQGTALPAADKDAIAGVFQSEEVDGDTLLGFQVMPLLHSPLWLRRCVEPRPAVLTPHMLMMRAEQSGDENRTGSTARQSQQAVGGSLAAEGEQRGGRPRRR
jgi:hypothetical protein